MHKDLKDFNLGNRLLIVGMSWEQPSSVDKGTSLMYVISRLGFPANGFRGIRSDSSQMRLRWHPYPRREQAGGELMVKHPQKHT